MSYQRTVTRSPSKSTVSYTSTHPTSSEVGVIQGSRVDDAKETAEVEFGEDFEDGDGVTVKILQG
jgi:hypothetical protein